MVFDAFNILLLDLGRKAEDRKKTAERMVSLLDELSYVVTGGRERESAVLLVVDESKLAQFLHHARDGGLFDLKAVCDIDDASVALLVDQFLDALQIIFRALAWEWRGWHVFGSVMVASYLEKASLG